MSSLPIQALFAPLQQALGDHSQIILEAPTGAGKSTALPLAMLQWPQISGKILMLEPRRVAARSVAQFIAKSLGEKVGERVGYRVRGESRVGANTRLEIVTEGILTRMIQQDPELEGIEVIIFDEIHERHLPTDLGLALALEVQDSLREDLKIIAMSATLSGLPLSQLMPDAATLVSQGRSFDVETLYRPVMGQVQWLSHLSQVVIDSVSSSNTVPSDYQHGSVLVFLPGKGEINQLQRLLSQRLDPNEFLLCPLYGDLSPAEQDKAISPAPSGKRKIVIATNVAESSLTIDGITIVIDSGYKREASFNPRTGVSRLSLRRISQASSIQRAGRAGRLQKGCCVRLWGQEEQSRMMVADAPEITQSELTSMAFDCAYWGVSDIESLPLLTKPPAIHQQVAWQLLAKLELVDEQHKITAQGQAAYELGCHPRLAHMLLTSQALAKSQQQADLVLLACLLAAVLEARGLPKKGADISQYLGLATQGQMATQVNKWQRALSAKGDIKQVARDAASRDISLLLALAYPDRIAKARGKLGFALSNGTGVTIDAEDAMANQAWLVVADFQETQGRNAGGVYLAAAINPEHFQQELKFLTHEVKICQWDETKGRFFAEKQTRVGEVIIQRAQETQVDNKLIQQALLSHIRAKGLTVLDLGESFLQLQYRLKLAQQFAPQHDWPNLDDASLLASLEQWLAPYLAEVNSIAKLQKLDTFGHVKNLLTWQQQQTLNELLPTHWQMATGTRAPIEYQVVAAQAVESEADGSDSDKQSMENDAADSNKAVSGRALLKVRLQEALGLSQSPLLLHGKLTVTMELLSPAQRPIAVTADLASFWQGPYIEVKKEMRGRYPRHLWPDDPVNTTATKFTKKKTPGLNC
ncbi:ATP-dependent helicase HrpB [Shewanella sp. 10N.286.52.B9]|uniref:ATP-dependent helicase HrpB n=1 Tax=Shewanella sp. 10N.286.52.B9 TaxID=1880837 RepID=UPI000C851ED8|nr:ATP-dependent helicase HrpB [Shewanella sp. 10N.286.52.B9]PMG43587.1 ATP-dependent helicase HrpB [Shewanella sp. 10N.286.52.B9]